ncbi:unnamed protein product [Camellia sinensis]
MFQENHKHPLGGIRRKAATLSTSVMRLSAHPSFVKALRLMTTVEEGALEGKLLYVHCEAHLDYFNYGSGSNAVVVAAGSPQTFSSIKAELTSAVSDILEAEDEDAFESLQKSCEFVCPNDGFLEKLKMFEEMGDSYNRREGIDTSKFGANPGLPTEEASADVGISGNSGRVSSRAYRCNKCRRVVALQENIVDHVPGGRETSFGWHKRKGGNPFNKCDKIECSSIFVEPLRWMTTGGFGWNCIDCDMLHVVREHLFIGNISDAAEVLQNGSKEITHILSILSSASISFFSEWRSGLSIPTEEICKVYAGDSELEDVLGDNSKSSLSPEKLLYSLEYAGNDLKLVRMAVPLRDTENENLLEYLDVCLDVIDKSRKEGSMLVHCFAGVSRSAAIITAYLMRTEQLSKEDALESLQKSCEFVCPNDGFLEQLKMFEEMGFKVDHASPIYKRFRSKVLGDSYNFSTAAYRCKKCRRVVALQENIVDHGPGEGETSFGWHKRKGGNPFNKCDEIECSSIFVEPLRWMTTVLKKVHWRASFYVHIVKLAWVTSTGQASNAVVVAGSPQPFSSIKAELTLALSDIFQHRRGMCLSPCLKIEDGKEGAYMYPNIYLVIILNCGTNNMRAQFLSRWLDV